mmetsp:Transcript_13272/g.27479  ORF Transcript_13272/g.27479 Transcript_13272/m.27479 type:complete len:99 (-) Transcript_13272:1245-1541(-)
MRCLHNPNPQKIPYSFEAMSSTTRTSQKAESLPSRRAVIKNPPDSIFESRYIPTIAVRTMALSLNWCSRVGRQRMTHQFATLRIHHAFRYLLHALPFV